MKKLVLLFILLSLSGVTFSQLGGLTNKLGQKVNEKVNQSIDNAGKKSKKDNSSDTEKTDSNTDDNNSTNSSQTVNTPTFQSYSKFDFISGEKVIVFEDFNQDNIGDFPDKWNTNGSGEVVTINNYPGKWFSMGQQAYYKPEYINNNLPDNFTLEFDLIIKTEGESGSFYLQLGRQREANELYPSNSGAQIQFTCSNENYISTLNWCYIDDCKTTTPVSNSSSYRFNSSGQKIRVSLWRQKQRLRVYVNDTKIFDLPKMLDANLPLNCINFQTYAYENSKFAFVSNIRLAAGAPDTRNKLITEGKFVTSGILFDVNSDQIKPESYGVLKEIAAVLKENPTVKIKIVGHTDSDGEDAQNLELSKKRAVSVKNILSKEFGIEDARMQTDGKGETLPISSNTTAEGKANNRRVEFIKQ